jgi:TM2 domain
MLGVDQFYARHWPLAIFKLFTGGGLAVWALVDVILWIIGGFYGTPGCPCGSGMWQH